MKTLRVQNIISLTTCFFLILAVTICKGNKFGSILSDKENATENPIGTSDILRHTDEGVQIISTRQITKDINGYGGNVPLEIYMQDNRITKVVALENSETPSYFAKVRSSDLLQQWNNLSPEEAINKEVDGISGATESSVAIIQSIHRAMEYAKKHKQERIPHVSPLAFQKQEIYSYRASDRNCDPGHSLRPSSSGSEQGERQGNGEGMPLESEKYRAVAGAVFRRIQWILSGRRRSEQRSPPLDGTAGEFLRDSEQSEEHNGAALPRIPESCGVRRVVHGQDLSVQCLSGDRRMGTRKVSEHLHHSETEVCRLERVSAEKRRMFERYSDHQRFPAE